MDPALRRSAPMTTRENRLSVLRLNSFMSQAPRPMLDEISFYAREETFAPHDFIFAKGDQAADFYILMDGRVGHPEVRLNDHNLSITQETATPGQLFGYAAAVQGAARVISARCETETKVLAIDGRRFQETCQRNGPQGEALVRELARIYASYEFKTTGQSGWISIRNASKVYSPGPNSVVALDNCSIEIRPGEFCAIVGPSGCGKSTLLNAIAGFDELSDGVVYLDGEWINRPGSAPKPGPDRIVVFQNGALFPWATIRENLIRGPLLRGVENEASVTKRAETLLARVGLSDVMDLYPGMISSGMCRRVEIIRAILNNPRVILLDEPFRGLDALSKAVTQNALLELYDMSKKTVLFITHDLEEAIYLADRVLVMSSRPGRIKQTIFVDLPRPRDIKMLGTPEFLRRKEEAIEAVHEEAVKAFTAGEREFA
ncbi:ATP-binding cassette domain-containing protein [Hansschlegelia sp. KR7-227]